LDGPGLQKRLAELGSILPIIFLTAYHDIPVTVQAIKAGAADVLTKPVASEDLFRAIERAFVHHRTLRDLKDKLDLVRAHVSALTPRERQVFELIVRGNTNKEVARAIVDGTDRQSSSPQGDGEDAGPHLAGTGVPCRADRYCVD
jgi:FixJ family two-component response regulator